MYKYGGVAIKFAACHTLESMARTENDNPSYRACELCVFCDQVCDKCPLPATKAGRCVGGTSEERYNSAYYKAIWSNNWDDFVTHGKIIAESLRGLWKCFDKKYV